MGALLGKKGSFTSFLLRARKRRPRKLHFLISEDIWNWDLLLAARTPSVVPGVRFGDDLRISQTGPVVKTC